MVAAALHLPVMADKKKPDTEQMGLRLNRAQLDRLREYANKHPMQPSLTRLIDVAIGEWLAAHEHELDDAKRK
jgi:hypothetical protein